MTATVDVWSVSVPSAPAAAIASLPEAERLRAKRLCRAADRRRRLVATALMHRAIARAAGCRPASVRVMRHCARCGVGDHGRPFVLRPAGCGLSVSAAHAGELAMVACTNGADVGVDVEHDDAVDVDAIAPVALADQERAAVTSPRALVRTWTRKEAILKALGCGLAYPPDRLVVSSPLGPPCVVAWLDAPPAHAQRPLALRDLTPAPGYVAAVAVTASTASLTLHDGLPLLAL